MEDIKVKEEIFDDSWTTIDKSPSTYEVKNELPILDQKEELMVDEKIIMDTENEPAVLKTSRKTNKLKPKLSIKALEEKRKKDKERQRKRRSKMSAEDLEKKRQYDKKYKEKRIAEGTWKQFRASMTEREKCKERKLVRERVRKCRQNKKESKKTSKFH